MRIALCTEIFNPSSGGVEKRVYEVTKRIEKKGIPVDIYTSSELSAIADELERFRIKQVSPFTVTQPPKRSFLKSIRFWLSLIRELRKSDFDIIDANGHLSLVPCAIISRIKKKPVIAALHDLYLDDWKYMTPGVSRFVGYALEVLTCKMHYTKMITVNASIKKALHEKFKIPLEDIIIIPNGINVKEIESIKAGKKEDNTVLFVGRLVPQKNVPLLIHAFAEAQKKLPNLRLEIIGDGIEKKRLEQMAQSLGIHKNTAFVGHMNNRDVLKRIKEATMLIIPSKRESFGITILESMICKTPVISTATEGPIDYIHTGVNGFLTAIDDPHEMAERIIELAKSKKLRKFIAKNAKKTAEGYDWDSISEQTISLFRKTLKEYNLKIKADLKKQKA